MMTNCNPVLVDVLRGGVVESTHRGRIALCTAEGNPRLAVGDTGTRIYPRSSYKILQALPLVESGAADAFALSARELALACASHSSEPAHVEAVRAWLDRIGCTVDDLACGPHRPYDGPVADALARSGAPPTRAHNNCSGKHTGFLTLARHLGAPTAGYTHRDHPVQQHVAATVAALAGVGPSELDGGIDGCSAPAFMLPLDTLARAMARIADPANLPPERAAAARRLYAATTLEPFYVAGTNRACTLLMQAAGGRAALKTGAEAVFVAVIPPMKCGIAVKIDDGGTRAAECVIANLLAVLGLADESDPRVARFTNPTVRSHTGEPAGEIRPAAPLREFMSALATFARTAGGHSAA